MLWKSATLEVSWETGKIISGMYEDEKGQDLALIQPTHTHQRSFWKGLWLDPFELTCLDEAGSFCWRLYSQRRGFRVGLCLSLIATDADSDSPQVDPLWTVGTLGREHLALPAGVVRTCAQDRVHSTLFWSGDKDRLLIYDDLDELWGSLEQEPGTQARPLCLWDGRRLGHIVPHEEHGETMYQITRVLPQDDRLLQAALEACPVAALWCR